MKLPDNPVQLIVQRGKAVVLQNLKKSWYEPADAGEGGHFIAPEGGVCQVVEAQDPADQADQRRVIQ